MIDHGLPLKDVRRDILRWPGARSIQEDHEPDVFAPTTLAVVAQWLADVPRAQALIAAAETSEWNRAAADELVDLLDEWRVRNNLANSKINEESHAAATIATHARKASAARHQNAQRDPSKLGQLQQAVLRAEKVYGRNAAPHVIADYLQRLRYHDGGHQQATSSNVAKARRALRAKGL